MSYLVLARKFRPQNFASVIGQQHITKALANAIVRGRVPHALLFTGPRGVGKTTTARVFAKAVNCTGREIVPADQVESEEQARQSVEPCGECPNCLEITRSASLAVWEIDGASNNSVDDVRQLIESLRSAPPHGSAYKIYIIDEVHMLSIAAFNALLKRLEEPPPNTVFIFATTEPQKIPETVLSRCQRHDFRSIPTSSIVAALKEIAAREGAEVEEQVFHIVARRAQGGMRDAQSLLDRLIAFSGKNLTVEDALQTFGIVDSGFLARISSAVIGKDAAEALALIDAAFNRSLDLRAFLADLLGHFRNLLLIKASRLSLEKVSRLAGVVEMPPGEVQELASQAERLSEIDCQRLFSTAERTVHLALQSSFPRYVIEAGIVQMSVLADLRPLPEIIAQLQSLSGGTPPPRRSNREQQTSTTSSSTKPASDPSPSKAVEAAPPEDAFREFNPSWQEFVVHVRSREEIRLASFLRLVSPVKFLHGELAVSGREFDLNSLKDPEMLEALQSCLHSYSGEKNWQIVFEPLKEDPSSRKGGKEQVLGGSIKELEAAAEADRNRRIEQEARNQPTVQNAINTFGGGKIERVTRLK